MTSSSLQMLSLVAALVAAGAFAGLIAGLFGVGGGTVIVPALFYAFAVLRLGGESNLHVAVGSSLAVIIATSFRSLAAHRAHGVVDDAVLKTWSPWVAVGGGVGAALAGVSSQEALTVVYAIAVTLVAAQLGLAKESWTLRSDLPGGWWRRGLGTFIGLLSAMMGVGGGAMGSMLMTLCGRPIHQAVATASGFGLAIGIPATLGFLVFGWDAPGRPPLSLGYVNVPAVLVMGLLTGAVAPYGAKLAHRLDRRMLRRAFAVFLVLTAISIAAKTL
ncbi:MAG TPA: sulfite exporter TauE/SafE family protein [Caulobacteraceae bacterium]|nr:sulfite exporter TauE/SafE family protein [Caulobacteraceae bacterium]